MTLQKKRALHIGSVSCLLLGAMSHNALADDTPTQLPDITVTAPSPIQRHRTAPTRTPSHVVRAAPSRNRERAAAVQPAPAAPAPAPQQGVLPVVTNQFATVTVIPNEELRRSGAATLGDLLFSKPGITGSSFAPGASSRPIIRGLDVNRVGIVENGLGGGGVSDLGEDHFVPIDPLSTNQIEVVRGPAALRYGSTSIGGVVSATNNRIPDAMPTCAAAPFQSYGLPVKAPLADAGAPGCLNVETRTSVSSVNRAVEGGMLLDAGGNNVAVHADVYGRTTSDYSIPSYPYLFVPGQPFNGRQPNSATQSDGASVGASYFFQGGYVGAAITQNDSLYHIPGIDGADHQTRIDAHQTKIAVKGEYRPDAAAIDAVRFWVGATDYRHNELGLADPTDLFSDGVRQTFTNKEQEARVEVQMMPFNARFATVTTAFGVQAGHQELTAPSPDDPTSLFNGLWSPNNNNRVAGYVFNEFKFTDSTKAQIAGRIEHVDLHGSMPNFPADYLPDGAPQSSIARNPSYTPVSGSIGLLQNLPGDLVGSITAQYVERAPKPAELFSRGAHDATATFDIGNPNLTIETAKSVEIGLRKATGPFRFEATAYYTRFSNFIYRRLTGVMCGDDFDSCGNGDPNNEARQAVYSQRDAIFRGAEFQSQFDIGPLNGGIWGIENQFDVVRATFTDGTNVPRIPPVRLGGGFYWRDSNWLTRINLVHAFAQNDIAVIGETPTAGYNLLNAEITYNTKLNQSWIGAREMTLGLVGNNLLNQNIRNSVSYTKDEVLMPGLGVRAFANLKF
ncbi:MULTISPECIES: TonB-dependent receptor [Bradyrhizobium]|jgi:iron complex outermembrane recepter protein|uniref:TonB-dependent receptor n=1 Tax=Bradyrhizobium TaxID=374 RepID=UPI0004845C15|nr:MULTISPECIES: TonB-dependent receptor [Bradyrhizobium]MCS3446762.1 iron complex outermembrane receptor protein [Bradyrhizobium elkanii]MCS3562104.1 iron complex outermembrane receptor protein [Bradyrhizobium elkanii]MCW2148058.1 iron complex outermembrane receptor protein [Bradyrhizobium elkanii]MCW2352858.1 iron complex outermembrane receptor protein [Bradyrhizobium elkanii]MCW2371784.1 iron complex outermembrane receptor protein [Bradyrhizobium elkanii]